MNLGDIIKQQVEYERKVRFVTSSQLSLGELIDKLEALPNKSMSVVLDFGPVPTCLSSWRGSYSELAIEYRDGDAPDVFTFILECRRAVSKTYEGYKGGDYVMGRETPVWVSQWGEAENNAVVGVRDAGDMIVIDTQEMEY